MEAADVLIPKIDIKPTVNQTSWKEKLQPREREQIPKVFQGVLDMTEQTLGDFKTMEKEVNRIAVVLSAYDANNLLPETLREITEQLKKSRFGGEIFVILNNGGGNTRDFVNSEMKQSQLEVITNEIGVNEIVFGKTESLDDTVPNSKAVPRKITLDRAVPQKMDGVRLVVVEQQNEPDNSGKIRGLRDVYEYLKQQNQETGYCPQYLFAIDAETRIRPVNAQRKEIITDDNSGLSHMIELSNEGKRMVGAKLQFVPYDDNGNPSWKEKTPPMQEAISIMHGMKGYEWLPGGGTLGGFPEMVSILNSISLKLPGTRIEDVLTTVTAKSLGIETVVDEQVAHANKCPSESDRQAIFAQMERWLKGAEGMKQVTGKHLAEKVISNGIIKIITYPLKELARGRKVDISHLLTGLPNYVKASRLAKGEPDDFVEGV